MRINAEQFDKAFAEFQAFGPRRRIPVEERWREVLPGVASEEFASLKTQCQEVEAFASHLAEQVRDGRISDEVARKQFAEKYPFSTRERLGHTWSQAVYFSLK